MRLRFASYNIRKAIGADRKRDPERIVAVLREVDADVIALQEADRRIGERASAIPRAVLDDSPWRALPLGGRPRSLGWHGNALLVRRDIALVECEALALPTIEPRGAVRAALALGAMRFEVFGVHLDISGMRRRDQVRAILAASDRAVPTVILGDFNQWGARTGAMREFADGWIGLAPGRSFPANRPLARLDRIMLTREWSIAGTGVHHSALAGQASDHLPVWADLKLPEN